MPTTPHSLSVDFGVSVFYASLLLCDLINNLPEPQFPHPDDAADYIFSELSQHSSKIMHVKTQVPEHGKSSVNGK